MTQARKPDGSELRKELNSLWQSTIDQFDEIKNAIVRSSQAGKARLDAQFLKRQRERLLTKLGEDVLRAASLGEIALPATCTETARRITELEEQIASEEAEAARLMSQHSGEGPPAATPDPAETTARAEPPRTSRLGTEQGPQKNRD